MARDFASVIPMMECEVLCSCPYRASHTSCVGVVQTTLCTPVLSFEADREDASDASDATEGASNVAKLGVGTIMELELC